MVGGGVTVPPVAVSAFFVESDLQPTSPALSTTAIASAASFFEPVIPIAFPFIPMLPVPSASSGTGWVAGMRIAAETKPCERRLGGSGNPAIRGVSRPRTGGFASPPFSGYALFQTGRSVLRNRFNGNGLSPFLRVPSHYVDRIYGPGSGTEAVSP